MRGILFFFTSSSIGTTEATDECEQEDDEDELAALEAGTEVGRKGGFNAARIHVIASRSSF